ncbi:RNA polymerase sigma factor [Novosphingobium sp. CF614]|uniref:RNA polymerase sigma factor n=1 Tax=Novosphingobium sp. CF614 TaxID=1884364 RepID=UPI000B85E768|nr:RNA polymerase sigma factor [Novosphingobium sp. CF614]
MSTNALSLTRLLMRERPSLLRVAQRIVGNAPAAEDVTQALWLRVQRIEDDPPIVHKRAFLYRLASNLATDRLRAERRYDALFDSGEPALDIPLDAPSAEQQLLDREQLDRLMCAVDDLSPRCREVFILRKLEDMPVHEICQRLGITRSMVARHMHNALRHLFARMQDNGE